MRMAALTGARRMRRAVRNAPGIARVRAAGPQHQGLVIDSFAGGGGASTGIERALGRPVDVAINHDPEAVALHAANHPATRHYCQSVWKADPLEVTGGRPVDLAWFSPDCKHFSKAKGGKPVEKNIRDLAWVVVLWARRVRPRVIMLENVEEFRDWGPLIEAEDGRLRPCPLRKGLTYRRWKRELVKLGYTVEERKLRACDYGAPTIRKRLFVVARCDGQPIVWPAPMHADPRAIAARQPNGAGPLLPWRTAAECIDWSIPCPSIFTRTRPLAEATLRRIARGVMRYVVNAEMPFIVPAPGRAGGPFIVGVGGRMGQSPERPVSAPFQTVTAKGDSALVEPFIVPITHTGDLRGHPVSEPLRTITTAHRGEQALVAPYLVPRYGERPAGLAGISSGSRARRAGQEPRCQPIDQPLSTVVPTANGAQLVAAFLAQHNTGVVGHGAQEPVSTIVGKGCTQGVVAAMLSHAYTSNTCGGNGDPRAPMKTVTTGGHHALVAAFLQKYYGTDQDPRLTEPLHTVTTKDRFGVVHARLARNQKMLSATPTVDIDGQTWAIADIGMRMLTPRELFNAQGFPAGYIIDPIMNGRPLTRTAQIRMCGNSVCPPVAEALVQANLAGQERPAHAREAAL